MPNRTISSYDGNSNLVSSPMLRVFLQDALENPRLTSNRAVYRDLYKAAFEAGFISTEQYQSLAND